MKALICLAVLLATAPLAAQGGPEQPRTFGPRRTFAGVYVTNFEINYFVECDVAAGGCAGWLHHELISLRVAGPTLNRTITDCIARWNGSLERWALFAIRFEGRETLDRRPKLNMYGTERYVVIDEAPALELIGTDETVGWALPRYRRLPTMRC